MEANRLYSIENLEISFKIKKKEEIPKYSR